MVPHVELPRPVGIHGDRRKIGQLDETEIMFSPCLFVCLLAGSCKKKLLAQRSQNSVERWHVAMEKPIRMGLVHFLVRYC